MDDLARALSDTGLSAFINAHAWVWPALETLHFFGLSVLIGALLIVDLSLLGLIGRGPLRALAPFTRLAGAGLALNIATGLLFVIGDPGRYFPNPAFQWKMALVAIALLNVAFYSARAGAYVAAGRAARDLPFDAKASAVLSLLLWTAVIAGGRLIPFYE